MARRSASEASTLGTLSPGGRRAPTPFGINVVARGDHGRMTDSGEFDARPVRAFLPGPGARDQGPGESRWPASVPAMAQLLREGLEVPTGLTVLVGENGSGKSTVMETLAEAYGLNPQGGSALGQTFRIRDSEPGVGQELIVVRGMRPRWSYFLRADTMNQLYGYLEQNPGKSADRFFELSHGEGFGGDPADPGERDRLLPAGRAGRAAVVHRLARAGGAAARPGRGRVPDRRGHPLPRARRDSRRAPARARVVGNSARHLGRPEPGSGVAAVHARPASIFPASVVTVADRRIAAWMCP